MVKRCSKCILPETGPNITFDENGVCYYYNEYIRKKNSMAINKAENARILERLISEARKRRLQKGAKYDVLVPLSGGRDSSYVAYALTVKKDLRVLCANYDNPFSSKQATVNIDQIVNKLNVDLVTFKWPKNRHEKSFRNNLKARG